ncbi:MAG: CDP-alcohol phosphatidyltransferase family protein [Elusimicrobiales bacterium]|nr:CDP-alcohol phosphatidyltransferase family protein [Elusimicrobiales bacterium]
MTETPKYPGMREIMAAHEDKREYERRLFASRFVFRPPSFPAIWLLVRLGVSSEGASWLSGFFALCGLSCLLWPSGPLLWPGVLFLCLFNFMDCIDGGIARIMGTRNPYGRFLDSIMWWADMLFWGVLGIAVWRMPELSGFGNSLGIPSGFWVAAGGAVSFLASYGAYLDSVFDLTLKAYWEKLRGDAGMVPSSTPLQGKRGVEVFLRVMMHNLRVRETHYLLLAAAFALRAADLFLAFFLLFYSVMTLALLVSYCRRGREVFMSGLGRSPAS